jgi:hypothetical protein
VLGKEALNFQISMQRLSEWEMIGIKTALHSVADAVSRQKGPVFDTPPFA